MVASPYGFLRGATIVMAHDLSRLPATGITPVICGDAHLGNFGFYASPERDLVLDLNDFDEAHPGPWEWDLRRLVTSIWIAGRQNGSRKSQCGDAVMACVASYRESMRVPCEPAAAVALVSAPGRRPVAHYGDGEIVARDDCAGRRLARTRTSDRALPRFTTGRGGRRRIVEKPPLISRVTAEPAQRIAAALDDYLGTLAPHWRRVVAGYTLVDVAHKVVGVSSVGLRSYVALLEGSSPDDVIFLQLKAGPAIGRGSLRPWRVGQARPSGTARRGVSAGAANRQRSAARLDDDRRPALLRSPVSRHERLDSARRDQSRRADRLRAGSLVSCWPRDMRARAGRR